MVPSEPQDFPGPHPGCEGEKEGLRYLTFDRASKSGDYGAYLQFSYSPAAGWRQKEPVTAPIIGATKIPHLEEAVGALSVKLTPEVSYIPG